MAPMWHKVNNANEILVFEKRVIKFMR